MVNIEYRLFDAIAARLALLVVNDEDYKHPPHFWLQAQCSLIALI